MLAKINYATGAIFAFTLALALSGCTPAGPSALLNGKKCLDRGDVDEAVVQLKRATTLLATNASAWNYLGVALQRAGQPDEAATAYQTAIRLDHDLLEARYNLGNLALDQNKPDAANSEFTAYTLRRPNDANGWLKLGLAQLRTPGDTLSAERSFSKVLSLKTNEAEAYNGLGMATLQAGKPRDAARFFAAAIQARPDYPSALQNLATVNLQYLHDNKAALANFQAYLALNPRPANYNDVKAIVAGLMPAEPVPAPAPPAVTTPPPAPPAVAVRTAPPPPAETKPRISSPPPTHPAPAVHTNPEPVYAVRNPPRTSTSAAPPAQTAPAPSVPTQTVQIQPEPEIVVSPRPVTPAPAPSRPTVSQAGSAANPIVVQGSGDMPAPQEQPRSGFWQRWFGNKPTDMPRPVNDTNEPPPAPGTVDDLTGGTLVEKTVPVETKPQSHPQPQPTPITSFKRYHYTSPAKPAAGDRNPADGAFTKARMAEQDENWRDAQRWYLSATDFDPSWYEAQFNAAVSAQRLGNYSLALPHYELALAIQPGSVDARYYFALTLQAAGYPVDAEAELKKILATSPDEVRAHLTLANLCAQTLHDVPQARQHYLRVLALEPDNPHASDIRFWLSANSK